jgi:hypothetical protein
MASRLRADPGSSTRLRKLAGTCSGGEGVESGAEEGAVVWDDTEGTLWFLPGVEIPDTNEPRERSGSVMADCEDESARALSAADMMLKVAWSMLSKTDQILPLKRSCTELRSNGLAHRNVYWT